jgi:hypothetical protein
MFRLLSFLLITPLLWAGSLEKDAKKLDKELKKISLTAAVIDGRRVVNRMMAEQLAISRKQLVEISQQHQVNLKQFLRDAKELNKRIDKELDRVASGEEKEETEDTEDTADSYEPSDDSLIADTAGFTPLEITQADAQVHRRGIPSMDGGTLSPGRGIGGERGGSSLGRGAGVGGIGGGRGRGPR